ncbi:MAG: imidazole glycerol phosphate synthase subunit HisH [Candidatus Omnitrophica bacterium]|nr:imidazole glycerol phosphate synthase subunit HisH [Candidatus Omnitrophota bacterium]
MNMIAIIDYGMGNLHSVRKAFERMGAETIISNHPNELKKVEKIVLPGVGSFGDAVQALRKYGLEEVIYQHIQEKKPFLGICLGMHILLEASQESEAVAGLGIIPGVVKKFEASSHLKVPHIGWNQINFRRLNCPLFKGVDDASSVYFCHSYFAQPKDNMVIAATTDYGIEFCSILWKDNIFATQFHPEKSQQVGLKIIENFVTL